MYNEFMQKGSVVALGSFDGLHIGHMAVINNAKNLATMLDAVPCICTFSEHPLKALKGKEPPALFTGDVKDEAFRNTGIEVVKLDFASIMHMSPEASRGVLRRDPLQDPPRGRCLLRVQLHLR